MVSIPTQYHEGMPRIPVRLRLAGELLARLRVALRHAAGGRSAPSFDAGPLHIYFERRLVSLAGHRVVLTPKEYDVLKYLVTHADRALTHALILRAVWGPEYAAATQYLRNVVLSLRRKLEVDPARPRFILTEPGVGYRFAAAADA